MHNNHPKELLSMPRDTHERDAKRKFITMTNTNSQP